MVHGLLARLKIRVNDQLWSVIFQFRSVNSPQTPHKRHLGAKLLGILRIRFLVAASAINGFFVYFQVQSL